MAAGTKDLLKADPQLVKVFFITLYNLPLHISSAAPEAPVLTSRQLLNKGLKAVETNLISASQAIDTLSTYHSRIKDAHSHTICNAFIKMKRLIGIECLSTQFKDRHFNKRSWVLPLPGGLLSCVSLLCQSRADGEGHRERERHQSNGQLSGSNSSWRCQEQTNKMRSERLEFVWKWENSHYSHKMMNLWVHCSVFWLCACSLHQHQMHHWWKPNIWHSRLFFWLPLYC